MTESSASSSTKPSSLPPSRGIKAKRKADRLQRVVRDIMLPQIRCSREERACIEQRAADAGMILSSYIRTQALKGRVVVKQSQADDVLIQEVNRVGVNLNQIARALNRGESLPHGWEAVRRDTELVLDRLMGLSS